MTEFGNHSAAGFLCNMARMHILLPPEKLVLFPRDDVPRVIVTIDAEEEFNWKTYSRANTSVRNIAHQELAQRIFEKYGVVPTYAVDYPVATQPEGVQPLREWLQDGRCEIGAQLHPWVTPPYEEELGERNSFPGNLPPALEAAKLRSLTEAITKNFGVLPIMYRAGRYGFGPHTTAALIDLGYQIDGSMLPWVDMTRRYGPDYRRIGTAPFWLDADRKLLEFPITVGLVGLLERFDLGARVYPIAASHLGLRLKIPALLARMGFLNRVRLSPEGTPLKEAKVATRWLFSHGLRYFCISFHSPSLVPGFTPYVTNPKERTAFLDWLDAYLAFFMGELGGSPSTPSQMRERALSVADISFAPLSTVAPNTVTN